MAALFEASASHPPIVCGTAVKCGGCVSTRVVQQSTKRGGQQLTKRGVHHPHVRRFFHVSTRGVMVVDEGRHYGFGLAVEVDDGGWMWMGDEDENL